MKVVIVGYGVQGKKRLRIAGDDAAGVVDPVAPDADWKEITTCRWTAMTRRWSAPPMRPK